jgi:predicted TIM-barrel fold metal-dependent hydrolase
MRSIAMSYKAPFDLMAALISHRLFERFPNLRMASIEMGAFWVAWLFQAMGRSYKQDPSYFAEDPLETFRRHIWIAPFHEDRIIDLRDLLGAENMLLGSDWPHAEGLADPSEFANELNGFSDTEVKMVMRDNALSLSQRRPI